MSRNATYLACVGEKHRKDYGQFFTHPTVAAFMVGWALESGKKAIFDPGFGLGAFFDPIEDRPDIRFSGCEIDPTILDFWKSATQRKIDFIENEDYLLSWDKTCENIVCNPPYMRFQKFLNRDEVLRVFLDKLGLKLSGYTNTASAFLLKSISEIGNSGRVAYIMPLEFLNARYGAIIKRRLIEDRHLVAMISFECEKDVFPDATTSVGIVLYDASRYREYVDFHVVKSMASLATILDQSPVSRIATCELDPDSKWLPYFQSYTFAVSPNETVPLNYFGRFSRGIATGANEFFVLRPSLARKLGIGHSEVIPCIAKSALIKKSVFENEDCEMLIQNDAPILLFSANINPSKQAARYIQQGEQKGYHKRFLTKSRNPWYKTERRGPAPLLLGVFSRGGYKIVRNKSNALTLTCFHGFQPNLFGMKYLDHLFLYLTSASGRAIISLSKRKYGDALDKFEPNDLNDALVPSPKILDALSKDQIENAILHTKKTGHIPAEIDDFFAKLKIPNGAIQAISKQPHKNADEWRKDHP